VTGVAEFLLHCAELGLSVHIGTSWDTAHVTRHPEGEVEPGWLCRINRTKHTDASIRGRVSIREVGGNPWIAARKAKEKLQAIIDRKESVGA
jgi:hypothetical protein